MFIPDSRVHKSVPGAGIIINAVIIFLTFFQGLRPYSGLHRAYFSSISIKYKWGYAYSFLLNFPGGMFIQGATFIPDSRVITSVLFHYL